MRATSIALLLLAPLLQLRAAATQQKPADPPRRDAKKGDFARFPLGLLGGSAEVLAGRASIEVLSVQKRSAAQRAGLRKGDLIVSIDGVTPPAHTRDINSLAGPMKALGDAVLAHVGAGPLALASFAILRRGRSPARGFRRGRARGRPGGILRVVPGGVRGAPSRLAPRSSTLLAERRADLLLGRALLVPDRARPLTPEPRHVRAIQPAELAAHVVGDVRERAAEIPRRGGTRALERAALPFAARRHRARTADDDAGGK